MGPTAGRGDGPLVGDPHSDRVLHLDFTPRRLYQDGLPRCGQEEAIVRNLAREGSVNHMLLLDLMARGPS